MDRPTRELLAANDAFYRAFERADPLAMDALWAGSDADTVIHPGWDICRGAINVGNSFRRIFGTGESLRIQLGQISTDIHGDIGRVTAIEHIYAPAARAMVGRVACTNVFLRVEGAWKMLLHHGSPVHVAMPDSEPEGDGEIN